MTEAATCNDMKVGQIWTCRECGIELQVVKACSDEEGSSCATESCEFTCCGEPLQLKQS